MNGLVNFSGGYFSTDLRPEVYEDGPVITRQLYDYINNVIYSDSKETPWFTTGDSLGQPYFRVTSESGIPRDVIGLPKKFVEEMNISEGFEMQMFLIVSPAFARFLTQSEKADARV